MLAESKNKDNLFPLPRRYRAELTEEEIQDILRYANERGIHGIARAKLLRLIRDLRAAHAVSI
jgi:FAD/FMN-containing dehydrogenase